MAYRDRPRRALLIKLGKYYINPYTITYLEEVSNDSGSRPPWTQVHFVSATLAHIDLHIDKVVEKINRAVMNHEEIELP